jgi:hypothetical protein
MSDERVWVSTSTAAKLHDLAPRTIRKRLAAGTLPGQQVNGVWMVAATVDELLLKGLDPETVALDTQGAAPAPETAPDPEESAESTRGRAVPRADGGPDRSGPDLTPIAQAMSELARRNEELAAAAAMWQERAMHLEARLEALPPGELREKRSLWQRILDAFNPSPPHDRA